MVKKILVLGATGLLGAPVARQLQADGFLVRIMARDVAKARSVFDESYEVVKGDVNDKVSLENALQGCQGVHISVGGPVDQISAENVAALAQACRIERITYVSGATVAEENRWFPMVAQKLDAEKAVQACGIPFTIFCPTWPMEQIARFARDGKPFMIGKQPCLLHFFAETDMACMVSTAYQKEEASNKRFYVYGPEPMTMHEAILRYCQVFYPGVDKVSTMPVWLARLLGAVTRNPGLKFAANLMGYFNKTAELGDATEANQILGAPGTTLDAWMSARK